MANVPKNKAKSICPIKCVLLSKLVFTADGRCCVNTSLMTDNLHLLHDKVQLV